MLDGGSRQEADRSSSEENVSCLKTKITGHDIYWVFVWKTGPRVYLCHSNVKTTQK